MRARATTVRTLLCSLVVVALAAVGLVVTSAQAGAVGGPPDCATVTAGSTVKCDYYVNHYLGSGNPQHTDAGTMSFSPSTITVGTAVTESATVLFDPYFDSLGAIGVSTVSLSLIGTVTDYSPHDGASVYSTGSETFITWNAGQEHNAPTNCPPDPLAQCGGIPTEEYAAGTSFTIHGVSSTQGSGTETYGATFNGSSGTGIASSGPIALVASTPTASFDVHPNGAAPGQYQFVSTSQDQAGSGLNQTWDLGDGTTAAGPAVTHTYTRPGTYHVTLQVQDVNGATDSVEHDVVVPPPTLTSSIVFVDSAGSPVPSVTPRIGDVVHYKLVLAASQNGVGALGDVHYVGDPLTLTAGAGSVTLSGPTPAVPANLILHPGDQRTFLYDATVTAAGLVRATTQATATDEAGDTVTSDQNQLSFGVSGLDVVLTVDPASYTEDSDANGKKPVTVTVTETLRNTSGTPLTNLNVRSVDVSRTKSGQLLDVTYLSGTKPDPVTGFPLAGITLAPGQSYELPSKTKYSVKDDGKIQFSSLVTAASSDGSTVTGTGSTLLTAKPKYYLEFTSRVVQGESAGSLLPAGTPITIEGTVRNLTDTATEDVGPLFAKVAGNAGLQGLRYDGKGVDPRELTDPGALTLDPGQSKQFTLKVLTAYSEPTFQGGVKHSGGTRATVEFTPWATVHLDDGTDVTTAVDYSDILVSDASLKHTVSIDDSIPIPENRKDVVAGAILYGGLEGLWDAASGMVTGLVSLPGLAASVLLTIVNTQNEIWDSFTQAQREQFAHSVTGAALPILQANLDRARNGPGKLSDQAVAFVQQYFTKVENEAATGNYTGMVALYSSFTTNALAQIMIPVVLGKLATSSEAVDAVASSQEQLQAKLAKLEPAIDSATSMKQVATTLLDLANGTELDFAQVAKLYGISESEAQELQKLAAKYKWALTVRSRAASSIDWIEEFQAMVKPEALKIKSVSELDIKLGYPKKSGGSLIFKEPEPLIQFRKTGESISTLVQDFVVKKGFTPGTEEYYSAINRVSDRIAEWNKYSKTYMAWSKRRWIDVSFNWEGNAMKDPTFGGTGKEVGFSLKPTGVQGEYEVQMFNAKARRYVPVTGDIDPIAFTHLDGSPLSPQEHAQLIDEMRTNPKLQAQHGESATYVDGGVNFIESQFKPGEPALQIGPDGRMRVVRFNTRLSVWQSATDYHLVWDGGVIYSGAGEVSDATLQVDWLTLGQDPRPAPSGHWLILPGNGLTVGENVGRCSVRFSTSATAPSLLINTAGEIVQVNAAGTGTVPSSLQDVCFSAGPQVDIEVQPVTIVNGTITAGSVEIPITGGAGVNTSNGFVVGQRVSIGAGTAQAETGTISAFGSIILAKPLRFDHPSGTTIVVLGAASNTGGGTDATQALATTGAGNVQAAWEWAAVFVVLGALLLVASRRRRPVSRT